MNQQYKTEDEYDMVPIGKDELTHKLQGLSGWKQISDTWIARKYTFDRYLDGIEFAKQIGEYAEKRQHHPNIQINYKTVTIEISSWRAKGITNLDIVMVQDFNTIYDNLANT